MLTLTEALGLALCPPRIKNLNNSMFANKERSIGTMVLQGMTMCGILVQEYRITLVWPVRDDKLPYSNAPRFYRYFIGMQVITSAILAIDSYTS